MTNIMVAALEDTIQLRGQEVNKMQSDYICKYVFDMFSYSTEIIIVGNIFWFRILMDKLSIMRCLILV